MNNMRDLEQSIMGAWNIVEDLKVLTAGVLEHGMTGDQISNVLIGLEELYSLKFQMLFDAYERASKAFYALRTEGTHKYSHHENTPTIHFREGSSF